MTSGSTVDPIESAMNNQKIDATILASAGKNWMKVAMVVALVSASSRQELAGEEDAFEAIAVRINALIDDGQLEAQGNTENWRASEIRRTQ